MFLYNRHEPTARVFAAVRAAAPPVLLLVGDGPRDADDAHKVAAARAVVEQIDWPCAVERNYAAANLGVGARMSSGISWVFSRVDEAILLEDDCLPDASFFGFCAELLARHRDDERVMMISGTNELEHWGDGGCDYVFSSYGNIWGWATWARAWKHYDYRARSLDDPRVREIVASELTEADEMAYRLASLDRVRRGECDTWDYQWTWSRLARRGLAAVSAVNLVSNMGFGPGATHTRVPDIASAHTPRHRAASPLRAPASIAADRAFDRAVFLHRRGSDPASMLGRGVALLEQRRHVHALILIDEVIRGGADTPMARYYKALALTGLGQRERAASTLRDLLAVDPRHAQARALLADLDGGGHG